MAGFSGYGVVLAALGLWIIGERTPVAWLLAGIVVAAMAGAGVTTRWGRQLGLLILAGVALIALPYTQVDSVGSRQVLTFLAFASAIVVVWFVIYRRSMARGWEERWIDAPVEQPIEKIGDLADDRTRALERLGFSLSHAFRLAPNEDPLAVVYINEPKRIWAELTYPRREDLNTGWSFTSLAGSVSLSTQRTRAIPAEPGDLVQALLGKTLEEGYQHHVEATRLLGRRGMRFDAVDRAAYRTHVRREASAYRVAFRDRPFQQARVADHVRRDGIGFAVGPLFEQDDIEVQVAAALGLARAV